MQTAFRKLTILGTGAALPANRLLAQEIDTRLGKRQGWAEKRLGILSRPVAKDEDQIDLAESAARQALDDAGVEPSDVDLLIFAAAVAYQSIPATAPLVQRRLGIPDGTCAAFDINATCLSFLTATDILASLLASGGYRRGLVVSAEIASRGLPWESDPMTAALFGDGAAAALFSCGDGTAGIVASRMETYPSGYDDCRLGAGGTRYDFHADPDSFARNTMFEMDGLALFRHTLTYFEPFLDRLLSGAGWTRQDIDLVIPHQASPLALKHLTDRCGFDAERIVDLTAEHGNQIAVSIPAALDAARRSGRLRPGMKALMIGTSAGLSLGGVALIA